MKIKQKLHLRWQALLCFGIMSVLSACVSVPVSIDYKPTDAVDPIITSRKEQVVLYFPAVEDQRPNKDIKHLHIGYVGSMWQATADISPSNVFHKSLSVELKRLGIEVTNDQDQAEGRLQGILKTFEVRSSMGQTGRARIDLELYQTGKKEPIWKSSLEGHGSGSAYSTAYGQEEALNFALSKAIGSLKHDVGFREKIESLVVTSRRYLEEQEALTEISIDLKSLDSKYRVVDKIAVIRLGPKPDSEVVKEIGLGGIVHIIGALPSGWMQVAREGEPIGWVHRESLRQEQPSEPVFSQVAEKRDTTPPSIMITSHKVSRGMTVVENVSRTEIKGKAVDPSGVAEVTINGETTSLDAEGNFSGNVFLKVGKNRIIVTAMDTRENTARKSLVIERNPKVSMVSRADVGKEEGFGDFHALIIGNNNYQYLPGLQTARNDAVEMEKALREKYGFDTEVLLDATRSDILNSLNRFRNRLGVNDNFMIYYAGHGEFDSTATKAYWLPVDAEPDNDANWIIVDSITANVKRFASRHVLIVADSCYSGTMTRSSTTRVESNKERDKYLNKMLKKTSRTLMASGGDEPVADSGGDLPPFLVPPLKLEFVLIQTVGA